MARMKSKNTRGPVQAQGSKVTGRTDPEWTTAANAWSRAEKASKRATLKLNEARDNLLTLAGKASANGQGVWATRFFRSGEIDYGRIPELEDVDMDAYRKPGGWQFRLTRRASGEKGADG